MCRAKVTGLILSKCVLARGLPHFGNFVAHTTSEAASIYCGSRLAGNLRLVAGPTRWIEGVLGRSAPQQKDKRVVLVISYFRSTELGAVPMAVRLGLIW
jgi:hypothetical protein